MSSKPPSVPPKKDGDKEKRFPNSLSAIVRAVYVKWLPQLEGIPDRETSLPVFAKNSNFGDYYLKVVQRFPGTRASAVNEERTQYDSNKLITMLRRLGTGERGLEYYHLRSIADYLGVSDSVILIFGMLTSIDRRVDGDDVERRTLAMLEFLDAIKRSVAAMEKHVHLINGEKESFSRVHSEAEDGKDIWIANAEILFDVVEAFNDGNLHEYHAANAMK